MLQFYERLRWFEQASAKHKQEMMQKTSREVSDVIERNLASQYRLRAPDTDDPFDVLQGMTASLHIQGYV